MKLEQPSEPRINIPLREETLRNLVFADEANQIPSVRRLFEEIIIERDPKEIATFLNIAITNVQILDGETPNSENDQNSSPKNPISDEESPPRITSKIGFENHARPKSSPRIREPRNIGFPKTEPEILQASFTREVLQRIIAKHLPDEERTSANVNDIITEICLGTYSLESFIRESQIPNQARQIGFAPENGKGNESKEPQEKRPIGFTVDI